MDPIAELVRLLSRLPGIGERTAARLAYHVLAGEQDYAKALGGALSAIHDRVRPCASCGNYSADERCAICTDPRRDPAVLCVVARVPDLAAIERSGTFRGRYFVLHALLAPLDGIGPHDLPMAWFLRRVDEDRVQEGEATALYIAQVLHDRGVKVSRIASGVPHGGELEFTDQVTLVRAIDGRRTL